MKQKNKRNNQGGSQFTGQSWLKSQLNGCDLCFVMVISVMVFYHDSWKSNHLNDQIPLPSLLPYARRENKMEKQLCTGWSLFWFHSTKQYQIKLSHIPWPVGWPIFLSANGPTSMKTAICRWLRFIHFVLQMSMHDSCSKLEWREKKK